MYIFTPNSGQLKQPYMFQCNGSKLLHYVRENGKYLCSRSTDLYKDWIARGSVILTPPSRRHVAPSRWQSATFSMLNGSTSAKHFLTLG